MNLSIKHHVLGSIVPVYCADITGTAFFISSAQLLTARHNVIDAILQPNEVKIYIKYKEEYIQCEVTVLPDENEKDKDIVILTIVEDTIQIDTDPLTLLDSHFNHEMSFDTYGFPKELANCTHAFHLKLGFVERLSGSEADIILVKKSDVSFFSYEGYSGAPVLNENGKVIAILIIQEYKNLRAISIRQLSSLLLNNGIEITSNSLEEDTTSTGLGYCLSLWNRHRQKIGSKYTPNQHQHHTKLETMMWLFMNPNAQTEYDSTLSKVIAWCKQKPKIGNIICNDTYSEEAVKEYLNKIQNDDDLYIRNTQSVKECSKCIQDLENYSNRISLSKKTFLGIFGSAGVGKSHMCSHLGYKYLSEGHFVYFCLGTDFASSEDSFTQLLKILGLSINHLEQIESIANDRNKFILIIIDAINEGCGFNYWNAELPKLYDSIKRFKRIKVLISGRRHGSGIYNILARHPQIGPDKSITFSLEGFEDTFSSLNYFSNKYSIPVDQILKLGVDFTNPLMLSIFCQSYQLHSQIGSYDRLKVYEDYLKRRNNVISQAIDEDPAKQITLKAVERIAHYSIFHGTLKDVSRKIAAKICNHISFRREWSVNLLNHLIKENILFEIGENLAYEHQEVDFEFQNFGDVFRAKALLNSNISDDEIIKSLLYLKEKNGYITDVAKNCLIATLGIWFRQSKPLKMLNNLTDNILEEVLSYGGPLNKEIENIWSTRFGEIPILQIFRNNLFLSVNFILQYHNYLKKLPLAVRDLAYIHAVNNPYEFNGIDIRSDISNLLETSEESAIKKLIFLGWLSLSSHPEFRSIVKRQLTKTLINWPSLSCRLSELFYDVNDPYILESVYCSIYGCLLISRDSEIANQVAKHIYTVFYANTGNKPADILVRHWTMQILELAHELDSSNMLYKQIASVLQENNNPFEWNLNAIEPETTFGNSLGGQKMTYTLFGIGNYGIASDFNRYIIGTNNHIDSPEFIQLNGESINLEIIEKMIAQSILNYGWTEKLGEIDTKGSHHGRHDNKVETIGKKYIWLGYYHVFALLSDSCKFNLDNIYDGPNNGYITNPYPWMLSSQTYFDPTLLIPAYANIPSPIIELHNKINNLDDVITHTEPRPDTYLAFSDQYGADWILISGCDSWASDDVDIYHQKHLFIEHESWFMKNYTSNQHPQLAEFCTTSGHSLPTNSNSQIHFLWNEYPWADRSKRYQYDNWQEINIGNIDVCSAFLTQMQEEYSGLTEQDDRKHSNMRILTERIMHALALYTAERGVIRCKSDKSIGAINRDLIDGRSGLFIRKDLLDTYLRENNLKLIIKREYMIVGYHSDDISYEWFLYDCDDGHTKLVPFTTIKRE